MDCNVGSRGKGESGHVFGKFGANSQVVKL